MATETHTPAPSAESHRQPRPVSEAEQGIESPLVPTQLRAPLTWRASAVVRAIRRRY